MSVWESAKVEATLVIHQKQELFVGDKRTSTSWSGGTDDGGACIPLGGGNRAQTDCLALALMQFLWILSARSWVRTKRCKWWCHSRNRRRLTFTFKCEWYCRKFRRQFATIIAIMRNRGCHANVFNRFKRTASEFTRNFQLRFAWNFQQPKWFQSVSANGIWRNLQWKLKTQS